MYYNNAIHHNMLIILKELGFWVNLSKEHPLFIKEIALSQEVIFNNDLKNNLNKNFSEFSKVSKRIVAAQQEYNLFNINYMTNQQLFLDVSNILKEIFIVNIDFLNSLKDLEDLQGKDNSWQIFINHIALEQKQLLQLCSSHSIKLKALGY